MEGIAKGIEFKDALTESGPIATPMAIEQLCSPSSIIIGGMGTEDGLDSQGKVISKSSLPLGAAEESNRGRLSSPPLNQAGLSNGKVYSIVAGYEKGDLRVVCGGWSTAVIDGGNQAAALRALNQGVEVGSNHNRVQCPSFGPGQSNISLTQWNGLDFVSGLDRNQGNTMGQANVQSKMDVGQQCLMENVGQKQSWASIAVDKQIREKTPMRFHQPIIRDDGTTVVHPPLEVALEGRKR